MANFVRFLIGLSLLPACWGVGRAFVDAVFTAAGRGGGFSAETIALLGGVLAFALCWLALPHPVRTYVLGHEVTHALWGLFFGARPSDFHVSAAGGSVRLTKSNLLITLAPYFFPFYTFVVIVAALITFAFLRPLPFLPFWMFLIGFTWAFHVLFTLETLTQEQPDVRLYGRLFSFAFIFLVNLLLVLVWLAATTSLTFGQLAGFLAHRLVNAYVGVASCVFAGVKWIYGKCSRP